MYGSLGREYRHRHTVKAYAEEDWTASRLTYAKKEEVERITMGRNRRRPIGGRWKMERSWLRGKRGRMI